MGIIAHGGNHGPNAVRTMVQRTRFETWLILREFLVLAFEERPVDAVLVLEANRGATIVRTWFLNVEHGQEVLSGDLADHQVTFLVLLLNHG